MRIRFCFVAAFFYALLLQGADQVSLTILHTNDTHSHMLPFSYADADARAPEFRGMSAYRDIGGIARRATLVHRIREELRQRGIPVWLVDVGDFSDGTPFSIEYQGEADVAAMNATGYDLGTLGNHEFINSAAQLRKLISLARWQLVCANANERNTGQPIVPRYVIRTIGELKIGIFGLAALESGTYRAGREGIDVAEEFETARQVTAELRPKVDILIAISHAGEKADLKLGADFPQIDVIIGGHSHSRLPSGSLVWHSDDLRRADVNGTVIVQAHQWGGELGRLDLLFAKDENGFWRVDRYRSRLIPITSALPEDERVAAVVDRYWKPISSKYGEVIGRAAAEFSTRDDDLAEYYLVDDALRETTGADFALGNLGGVRAPLLRGDITRGDLVTLDPFSNTVVTFTLTGRELLAILQRYTPTVSGIRYRIEQGQLKDVTLGGKPIEDQRAYRGVTNSFLAGRALKGIAVHDTGKVRMEVVAEYIRKKQTVHPSYDGRRVVESRR